MAFHIIFLFTCYATFHTALSVCLLVGHSYLLKWSCHLKYSSCPPARDLGSCVSSLVVIKCALSSFVSSTLILCSITIKNSQNGNTGIRHNRKKTVSPLRSVIAGYHCKLLWRLFSWEQGRIHGYPSRVCAGRSSAGECH